ncbi:MAG TPA: acetyl-CoA carboxylase biotin carboxylase subunit [Candidimonas sp.]|nr:acetyl-CoA carboxylase biotin carboxylase subunit [Candidimonas sp.]
MTTVIRKILVANRGEIAARILRSINNAGYRSIAVFSEADAGAPHVTIADQAICIGPPPVSESYLSIPAIIAAARRTGADAIHPGYGFLSENADFVTACSEAGLLFIGPSADSIRLMGDKRLAKNRMIAAGVPCIPGYQGADQSLGAMRLAAAEIGYPLMIKASAGGGGRGIRLIHAETELEAAMSSAASEARNAFGDGTLYLEKAIFGARHIEVQVVADSQGTTLHLGERDCSAQRRNQKVVEEAPSSAVSAELRKRMCADAVAAAKSIGYLGVGTIEFLLDHEGRHYFLEMNTRLQVEHPVTEMVTGLDLVDLQLRIAAGQPLGFTQEDVHFHGHAFEARLYTEDPAEGFTPRTGTVSAWRPAIGPHVRIDSGIVEGQTITPFYDPMVAKLIAWGTTRDDARRRLARAVDDTVFMGVGNNRRYLHRLLNDPVLIAGEVTTDYLNSQQTLCDLEDTPPIMRAVAATLLCWPAAVTLDGWRQGGDGAWTVVFADSSKPAQVRRARNGEVTVTWADTQVRFMPLARGDGALRISTASVQETVQYCQRLNSVEVCWRGLDAAFVEHDTRAPDLQAGGSGTLRAPMSASVINVMVAVGDQVRLHQPLFVLEAMKMELEIRAEVAGTVMSVNTKTGAQVSAQQVLAEIVNVEATS